jgi:tripartite-type tricarboxylate transporter receptor subunit TctC
MKTTRATKALVKLAAFAVAATIGSAAWAAEYPTKPIRLICAHVAGGAVDLLARVVAQKLSDNLGQPVIVENRPGAAGTVGASAVAKSAADGYTLLISTNAPLSTNVALYKLDYDWRDFDPVNIIGEGLLFVLVNPSLPVKSMQDLVTLAKQKPGSLSAASAGNGSIGHFMVTEMQKSYGASMVHVPYKGGLPGVAATASGEVQVGFLDAGAAAPFIRDNRVKALAVTGSKRSSALPDIPTLAELKMKGGDLVAWIGVFAPKGTPKDIVQKLNAEVNKQLKDPAIRQRMIAAGLEPSDGGTPEQYAEFLKQDVPRWYERVKDANIKVE